MKREPPRTLLDWLGVSDAPNWRVARHLGPLISLVLALLFVGAIGAAFGVIWHTVTSAFGSAPVGPSLGAGALIAALLGAPFLIWSTVIKQTTVNFQKETHITERISKAVEQLGAEKTVKDAGTERTVPNIEVRIGGLLSLERIAQDSTAYDKGRDHVRVMEILCAYVRENAPASGARDFPLPDWEPLSDEATAEEKAAHLAWREARFKGEGGPNAREWAQSLPDPRADIALALRILGRRSPEQLRVEARWGPEATSDAEWVFDTPCPVLPDLPKDQSHGAEVLKAYKTKLDAWKSRIAEYRGYRPDLRKTNLQKVDLSKLTMSGANLRWARMEGANLRWARMEGAVLEWARMEGADLEQARMEGAVLEQARMEGANLRWARMEGAVLWQARMEGAVLWQARMAGAHLVGARLATSLMFTDLCSVNLKEVNLSHSDLRQDQVDAAFGDASVTLPEGMKRPKHWPTWRLPDTGDHAFEAEWRRWQADPDTYTPPPPPPHAAG